MENNNTIVESKVFPIKDLFNQKYTVDFYQREYVWTKKQIEDLICDLSTEFLKNWKCDHTPQDIPRYSPYYMGEIVISIDCNDRNSVIDGQQRITSITLLLIYVLKIYGSLSDFPSDVVNPLIYSDYLGKKLFNLDIEDRNECMLSLYKSGTYSVKDTDNASVKNLIERYNDISECWNQAINAENIACFTYWLIYKVMFSKVWTNSNEFAYVIFETMNDRGLSLTPVEMLRSYLLAKINDEGKRKKSMKEFDSVISRVSSINLSSKTKAEFEFFNLFLRCHHAETLGQKTDSKTDFVEIGKHFHRWVRDNESKLGLNSEDGVIDFIDRIVFFANKYIDIMNISEQRDVSKYFYLIVNVDYGFTLQRAALMAAIAYKDPTEEVEKKIQLVSKYISKVLTWRTWNHWLISQSSLEDKIYGLCKKIRAKDYDTIYSILSSEPIDLPNLDQYPILNQQNRRRLCVMLALITEIVARESGESDYMLNKSNIEIEHIWADHYEWFEASEGFTDKGEFANVRNSIGDLLILPKSFNASYGDKRYKEKRMQYFSQNILAQTLCDEKYRNNPGFLAYKSRSGIDFKPFSEFHKAEISERTNLYREILKWNWRTL